MPGESFFSPPRTTQSSLYYTVVGPQADQVGAPSVYDTIDRMPNVSVVFETRMTATMEVQLTKPSPTASDHTPKEADAR